MEKSADKKILKIWVPHAFFHKVRLMALPLMLSAGLSFCSTTSRVNSKSPFKKISAPFPQPRSRTRPHRSLIVKSIAALRSAIAAAGPGDSVLLAAGTYHLDRDVDIYAQGESGAPIVIAGISSGQVILTGKGGISIQAPGAYIEVRDFVFRHNSSHARSGVGTRHCRWAHNLFETLGNGDGLTIAGDYQEVDHNSFLNKDAMGRFLAIRGHQSQIAARLWIHHNYFAHFKDQGGGNGAEAFQFGLSGYSMSMSNSLVEYNLFEDCHAEAELVSVKASGVTIRYNTFRNSKAQFTLRHGNHNKVYSNFFFNTPGIRFFGDDHLIYSNYFQDCKIAIQIGNGDGEVKDGALLTCHDRPDRDFVGFNTLINNKTGFLFQARNHGLGASRIQITGNIILGSGAVVQMEKSGGVLKASSWTDNVYATSEKNTHLKLPAHLFPHLFKTSGNKVKDPRLILKRENKSQPTFRLSVQSPDLLVEDSVPAIFSAGGAVDIDGQPRTGAFSAGADQPSSAPVINWPLTAPTPGIIGIP